MKLYQNQLTQHLNAHLALGYLISGDEPLLIQEANDAIRHAAKKKGFEEREVFHADAGFDWQHLLESASALSLFATRRILEVRLHGKPSDKGTTLKILLEQNNPDNLLIVTCPRLDASSQKTAWVKKFETDAAFLPIWPIEREHYPSWLKQRAQMAGLRLDQEALNFLALQTEGNLLAAVQEIEKLKLLNLDAINAEQMQQAISDHARFDAFALADMCLYGRPADAARILHSLRAEGLEPLLILGALTLKIRQLLQLKEHHNLEEGFKNLRIWPKQQPSFKQALTRLTLPKLQRCLHCAEEIDAAAKGSGDDVWRLLADLVNQLSGLHILPSFKI